MSHKKVPFKEIEQVIVDMIGLNKDTSIKLIPAVIADLLIENDLPFVRKNITNWYNLQTGLSDFSVDDLMKSTSISMDNAADLTVITDECFISREGLSLKCNDLRNFAEHTFPDIFHSDFVQPADYIFVSKDLKLISLIHHEGELFEFQG